MPPKSRIAIAFSSLFNFIGGISGLLAICLVAWKGGAIERQVLIDTGRIDLIESSGSPALKAHVDEDNTRVRDLDRRVTENESSLRQYGELKVEIRVIGTKLDSISDRLKGMEESANANAHAANAAAVAATAAANAAALAIKATSR